MKAGRRSLLLAFCLLVAMSVLQSFSGQLGQDYLVETMGVSKSHVDIIDQVFATLFSFSIAFFAIEIIRYFFWEGVYVRRTGHPASSILVQSLRITIWALTGVIVAFTVFQQELFAKASLGGGIIAIGYSMKDLLPNLISGFTFSITQPYKVGEWIKVDGVAGKVHEVKWTVTELVTPENTLVYVPNSKISNSMFENINRPSAAVKFVVTVHVDPTVPTQRVLTVLGSAIKSLPNSEVGKMPYVHPGGFSRDGRAFNIHAFAEDYSKMPGLRGLTRTTIFAALENAGIPITANLEYVGSVDKLPYSDPIDSFATLSKTSIFTNLTKKELRELAGHAEEKIYLAGQHIITQGDEGDSIFIIIKGSVKVTIKSGDKEQEVARLRAGHFFGEMSFLAGQPRSASVKTLTSVSVLQLSKKDISPLIEKRPDLIREFSEIIAVREKSNKALMEMEEEDPTSIIEDLIKEISTFFKGN